MSSRYDPRRGIRTFTWALEDIMEKERYETSLATVAEKMRKKGYIPSETLRVLPNIRQIRIEKQTVYWVGRRRDVRNR